MSDNLPPLLPCPFCGNKANIVMANEKHDHSGGYFIACPVCDASTGLRYAMGDDPRPLLVEQWNRRAAIEAKTLAVTASASVAIDYRQAVELVEMFGGEPAEVRLIHGDGHSGPGLYAYYDELPEEGANFLGETDPDAAPHPQPVAQPNGMQPFDVLTSIWNAMQNSADGDDLLSKLEHMRDSIERAVQGDQQQALQELADDAQLVYGGYTAQPVQAPPSVPSASFDDPRVQIVYNLICADEAPPNQEEHWDGWVSRRIVDSLFPANQQKE